MTAAEQLKAFTAIKPCSFSMGELLCFLNGAEGELYAVTPSAGEFLPFTEEDMEERQLLLSGRWTDIYTAYLSAETELYGGNIAAYANFAALYNSRLGEYRRELFDTRRTDSPVRFQNLY